MTPPKNHIDTASQEDLDLDQADRKFMALALRLAKAAERKGEVPIGAVIVDKSGKILARSGNVREQTLSTLGHAELAVIHRACRKLKSWRLIDCTLYVTLEPCFMCAGALVQARVGRVVFGTHDPKAGAVESLANIGADSRLNHRFEIKSGVLGDECAAILKDFFKKKRKAKTVSS